MLPQEAGSQGPSWTSSPRWYLWEGGFLLLAGSVGVVPAHSHHAIQLVITMQGEAGVAGEDETWRTGRGMIVPPNLVHSYSGRGSYGAMLFVDPDSIEGIWLQSTIGNRITIIPESRAIPAAEALRRFCERPLESMDVGSLIRYIVESLCAGAPPARRPDPRITKVLDAIAASPDLRISLERVAASVFLSPSRFQHLFKQQVGLAFRRYMLWRKVTRAMIAIARERTLAAAAQESDFADAAHLTRTFQQM
ncbi:MAG TPA: helix-turn-helix domain-containing protein, partial [Thermoanaerobaculia bacterium]|nr:helix-turn-helix domain-containing protein [Thermoanaerobaculia bacterium]